ncbi:hypothetical protein POKO110462_09875 [Pontibacter korlensis]|uniref:hypothetical protein n=1 Tax=Pontibacter korlensis TaxID=400092 RepID=UPI000697BCCF|nr:hypothetical protein [Pontibacter korlensis]
MRTKMLKYVLPALVLSVLTVGAAWAQAPKYVQDLNGVPIKLNQYENINGSPYLHIEWIEGRVVLGNGNIYEGVPLRYDLVSDRLMFKDKNGQELEFAQPVLEFQLAGEQNKYRSGFVPVDNHTSTSFYEVLEDGKVKLLKRSHKVVREEKAYGSATINKNIMGYTNYYLAKENELVKIKNGKALQEALSGHDAELAEYTKKNKLKLKDEAEMAQLVKYYNSL